MHNEITITGRIQSFGKVQKAKIITDADTGIIKDVLYTYDTAEKTDYEYDENHIILAGDINAHSHPEQSIYTDMVDKSWDLATWCRNTIYKYSPYLDPEDIYLACCRAFSRMVSYGVTSVFVSFYCHNNRGNEFDRAVVKAAEDTGIRLYFGRMNYDIITPDAYEAKKKSQRCYFEAVEEAEVSFKELLETISSKNVVIAPSIHSIHASTGAAVENALRLSEKFDRYVQFHLSEDSGDVDLSLKWYGLRPVEYLVSLVEKGTIGSLDRLLLSDCIWIDDKELELIKKYDMKVVLNPRMNQRIKAGEAKVRDFMEKGVPLYLGTDGEASNDDLSVTGEYGFLRNKYPDLSGKIDEYIGAVPLKFDKGYIGRIEKGCYCDLKVIHQNRIDDVFVGGRKIFESGRLLGKDMENGIEKPLKERVEKLKKQQE